MRRGFALALDNTRLYRELAIADRAKDEFLATLSHELRTPLDSIVGWVRMLRARQLDADKAAKALESIERNARLQDLLDVSRIVTGKFHLSPAMVDLAPVVHDALESVYAAAEAKQITIEADLAPVVVWGDAARLQQIAWNLLSNAVKFTPVAGRVAVRLHREDAEAMLTVTDDGEGVAAEFLPHLFERFRQADSTSTRAHGGLGLGLAIVRHLAEMHGGSVRAESAGKGLGATFIVRLPVAAASPLERSAAENAPSTTGATRLGGVRILAVDDDADARSIIEIALAGAGAYVRVVGSAAEALAAVRESRFDVLLADVGMPEMDGYALIRSVRTLPRALVDGIVAIAVTAYARDDDRERALAAGYAEHVSKPVDPDVLLAVVAKTLRRD